MIQRKESTDCKVQIGGQVLRTSIKKLNLTGVLLGRQGGRRVLSSSFSTEVTARSTSLDSGQERNYVYSLATQWWQDAVA